MSEAQTVSKWYYVDFEVNPDASVRSPLKGGRKKSQVGFFDAEEGAARFEGAVRYVSDFYPAAFVIRKVKTEPEAPAEATVRDADDWICSIKLICVDRDVSTVH